MPEDIPEFFIDDGLKTLEVGNWAKTKHKKIHYYCALFASSMKTKWDYRVYIDLFSGPGKGRIRRTNQIIPGSPLLALNIQDPFDKYIFCEKDTENAIALKKRVMEYFPDRNCKFIEGDVNSKLEEIFTSIPKFSKTFKGLSLCFVDPYKKGELDFNTIQVIAKRLYVDFLVLIPSFMDLNRNKHNYTRPNDNSLDKYLGTKGWRDRWNYFRGKKKHFGIFIAEEFGLQMHRLEYIFETIDDMEIIRMETERRLPLYHLAFFSRNPLGLQFWRETKRQTNPQMSFQF